MTDEILDLVWTAINDALVKESRRDGRRNDDLSEGLYWGFDGAENIERRYSVARSVLSALAALGLTGVVPTGGGAVMLGGGGGGGSDCACGDPKRPGVQHSAAACTNVPAGGVS